MSRYQHIADSVMDEVRAAYPHAHITIKRCLRRQSSLMRYDKKHKGKIHYEIECPPPKTTLDLADFLHEVGHLISGHARPSELKAGEIFYCLFYGSRTVPQRRQEQEIEASLWALRCMQKYGITTQYAMPYMQDCLFGYRIRLSLEGMLAA